MSNASESLRVGVLGVGVMGRHHARVAAASPAAELVGIFDPDDQAAAAAAQEYGGVAYTSAEQLADDIDAAIVAAPTVEHPRLARLLLERGVHVLVEKPIAATLEEADTMLAAAGDRVLAVGHIEFHNPAVQSLLDLGLTPGFVEVHRLGVFSPRSLDIDVVLDLMIHDLQILDRLIGSEVKSLHGVGINALSDHFDIASVRVEYVSGCVANLTASRVSREKVRKLRVFVPRGYYSLNYQTQEIQGYRLASGAAGKEIVPTAIDVVREEPLMRQLEAFLAACRGEEVRLVHGEDGRRALDLALRVVADCGRRLGSVVAPEAGHEV